MTLITVSCTKDFIVKDISNETINVIAPADNLTTPNNTITFWWDELDGAEKYNLQIVKPSFNSVLQLLVDTNISINKFNYTFTPGTYQWRIKAINSGGSTQYSVRSFVIDTTSNLSLVTVSPIAPIQNYLTGSKTINFSWNSLNAATYYELEVQDAQGGIVINPNNVSTTSYSYTFSNTTDVVYTWRVKAHNSTSFSQYNTARSFTIDVTAPSVSSFSHPNNGAIVTSNDSLMWTRPNPNDTKYDSIVVSVDTLFVSYLTRTKVAGTKLKLADMNPTLSPSSSYYWWRIISIDSVGNKSNASLPRKFKIN